MPSCSMLVRRHLVLGAFAVLSLILSLGAQAQPDTSFEGWLKVNIEEWQTQTGRWRTAGNVCLGLSSAVGILGIAVGALQALKRRWVKPAVAVLGVLVSALTFVKSQLYENDHHSYYRAADAAEQRLRRIKRWARPVEDEAERNEAIEQVRKLLEELDEIARGLGGPASGASQARLALLPVAHAQSLPESEKPAWLKGRAPDAENVYFVGVGLDPALDVAKRKALDGALAAARDDLVARLPPGAGYDASRLAAYLAEGAVTLDSYFDRDQKSGYRYYVCVALKKKRLEVDARLFGFRENVQVAQGTLDAVQSVRPTTTSSVDYQARRQETYAASESAARTRVPAEVYKSYESARAARQKGDPATAIPLLREAVRRAPDFFMAWYNLGLAHDALGQLDEAEKAYAQAAALEPKQPARDASIYNTWGFAQYRQKRYAEAREQAQKALLIEPAHASARRLLAAAEARLKP